MSYKCIKEIYNGSQTLFSNFLELKEFQMIVVIVIQLIRYTECNREK